MRIGRYVAVAAAAAALLTGAVATTLTLTACSIGEPPKTEYFYFVTGPTGEIRSGKGPRIGVADFSSAPGYDTQRMAFRTGTHELRYYGFRQWIAEPAKMLCTMVLRHLRASKHFAYVEEGDKVRDVDAVLEGRIDAIEEDDRQDKATRARLAMTFILRSAVSDKVLLRHAFDAYYPCAKRHPEEVARGVSKLLELQMRKLSRRIAEAAKR